MAVRIEKNGSVWTVKVKDESGKSSKQTYEDKLKFEGGRVTSENFAARGYAASNYSAEVRRGGETVVWKTMQSKVGGGTVHWRGELRGDKMAGIVVVRPRNGKAQNFSFTSESMEVSL